MTVASFNHCHPTMRADRTPRGAALYCFLRLTLINSHLRYDQDGHSAPRDPLVNERFLPKGAKTVHEES